MKRWVVIAVNAPGLGKTRLAGILDRAERQDLVRFMLDHVSATARSARNVDRVCLLGPAGQGLLDTMPRLPDAGEGLNAAVFSALRDLVGAGVSRALFLPADLPWITTRDIEDMVRLPGDIIGLAPDHHGIGTNAISLPLPGASDFAFAYGPQSFGRHCREAGRLGFAVRIFRRKGLAHDIDEPSDLQRMRRLAVKR